MVLTRTVEAQARIRIPQKILQKSFDQKLGGTDFTCYALPLPNLVLLVAAGHEKFDELKKLNSAAPKTPEEDLEEEESEYRKILSADSIWAVAAAYEAKGARYAFYLGVTAIHLGLVPAVGNKATVRVLPYSLEIWHPTNWVAGVTKVNAELFGYTVI
jgi:hypothetical protein